MTKYISVGKILNFHGIKGEAKVGFTKNQEDFFCSLKHVFVKCDGGYKPFEIENIRLNKNVALVKFANINSINELMEYKGAFLYVEENTVRESLEEDEFLIDNPLSFPEKASLHQKSFQQPLNIIDNDFFVFNTNISNDCFYKRYENNFFGICFDG